MGFNLTLKDQFIPFEQISLKHKINKVYINRFNNKICVYNVET